MRLLVTLDFPPEHGGIQRHLQGVVAHAFAKEDAVLVGCRRAPKSKAAGFPCRVTYVSFVFSRWNKKWSLLPLVLRCFLIRFSRGASISVECGNVYAGIAPWIVSLVMPIRYGVYAHGTELLALKRPTMAAAVLRTVCKNANRIIANSSYTSSLVRGMFPLATVDVVSPRIEVAPDRSSLSTTLKRDTGILRVLCVARLVRHKGLDVLIRALCLVPPALRWELIIAGEGPLREALEKQSRDSGNGGRVTIKPGLSDTDLEQEYRAASLFVLPTIPVHGTEGFGIVLLEAMAHRLPIVAARTGGIPEVLDHGQCGILVPPADPQSLCDAILSVAGNAALRERIVSNGYERLLKLYAWQ